MDFHGMQLEDALTTANAALLAAATPVARGRARMRVRRAVEALAAHQRNLTWRSGVSA